ncbi:MAG: zinc metalloprotease ZmpA, partial [Cryptosporangiaceae bacterium]|nr:zinc metalloprotease ZmpA [Cryptosporangiaceae bacterium]
MSSPRQGLRLLTAAVLSAASLAVVSAPAVAQPGPPPRPTTAQAAGEAKAAIAAHSGALMAAKGETYTPRGVIVDADGSRHVRFDRTYQGLSVLGEDTVVHSGPSGRYRGVTLAQTSRVALPTTTPKVPARVATDIAEHHVPGKRHAVGPPTLAVDAEAGTPALVWRVVVAGTTKAGAPSRLDVVLDAATGHVRRAAENIETAEGTGHGLQNGTVPLSTTQRADGSYELTDGTRGGTETLDAKNAEYPRRETSTPFTDADDDWGNGDRSDRPTMAADVHYGLQQTWDYFAGTFGRRGVAGDGKGIYAMVDYGVNAANASWSDSCYCLEFGANVPEERPFSSLDVVGHEFSHGVTANTAHLEYSGESGGLNEATSDIFGTMVEFAAANPADPGDYLVGEKVDKTPLRYMDEPSRDGESKSCWYPGVGAEDVHNSSGIGNKFFYQLAVGSGKSSWGDSPTCGDAPAVTGIGRDKAAAIWYRALTVYMVSNTNYAGARTATLTAAGDLYGTSSEEYGAVRAAWTAVGVDGSDPVPPAPQAPALMMAFWREAEINKALTLQLHAVDPQRQAVTFSVDQLPAGLSMTTDGLITGTPTTVGDVRSTVTVSDPDGN